MFITKESNLSAKSMAMVKLPHTLLDEMMTIPALY
jgi:hypothetical protein